jgi:hypothetical protein
MPLVIRFHGLKMLKILEGFRKNNHLDGWLFLGWVDLRKTDGSFGSCEGLSDRKFPKVAKIQFRLN